jgi:glutathione S-transferase
MMTITLCGFPLSNYYGKVKLVLLEKGIPFAEEVYGLGALQGEPARALSPIGKVPFLKTPQGGLCESTVICEYLEQIAPTPALLPADAWAAAKVREMTQVLELHLELVARELYGEAFFGASPISDARKARVRKLLDRNIPAYKRLARFAPYAAGDAFTLADCAAYVHLPVVALATKIVYGEDLMLAHGIDWKSYAKRIAPRPSAQRVDADRKADQERRLAEARSSGYKAG